MTTARGFWFAAAAILAAGCNNHLNYAQAAINANPTAVDFGIQMGGTQTTKTIQILSVGQAPLMITSIATTDDARGVFSVGAMPTQIAAGGSANLEVTYQPPSTPGADSANLVIASNAGASPDFTIALTGASVAACTSESDAAFCAALGKDCGPVMGADNCGVQRTVQCGPCPSPQTCGGQGVDGVCATPGFTVAVTLAGAGAGSVISIPAGIDCGATCSTSFAPGTQVTLSALADVSSSFAGFSGDCTGTSCSFTIEAAMNVTATFAPLYTLDVSANGSGSGTITSPATNGAIDCTASGNNTSGTCSAQLPAGTPVQLTATAASGSRFSGWSNACSGTTCSFDLSGDMTATADFIATFPISVTLAGSGSGSVSSNPAGINCGATCSSTFESGSNVTLTATPDGSSTFSGFSGACSGASCTLANLSSAQNVTATFAGAPNQLAFSRQPTSTTAGTIISPAVVVAVEDALGNPIVDSTAAITLSPSSGSLSGTVSAAAVNGSATFGDLSIDLTGSYTLMATSPGLAPATSDGFTISGNADAGPVECYALDAGPGTWATLTSCPNEHAETAGVAVGGSLYVVGGGPGQTGIVDAYDPIANSWTSKAGMNVPRGDSGVAAESGIIYVAGGLNGSNASIADLDMYNTATNAWTAGAQMPGGPRYHFPAVAVNGIVYAIGGWQSAGQGVALNRVEAYNPGSNSWTTVSSMPTARGGQAAAYLNGLIYVAGGCNGTCSSALNTVEAYDPVANSWTTKQALNVGRTQTAAGVVDGILLVVGGDDTGGNSLSSIEAYDPTTNSWTLKAPRPTAGAWLAVGGIGGSLYTMGDSTGHLLDAFTPCATGP